MFKHKTVAAALFASVVTALPFAASADRVIVVDAAPPAPRHEVIPHERHGYVWAPGYWDHRRGDWVWVKGHWEKAHHGQYWHPSRWEQRDGRYVFERGGWKRERYAANGDRDRDGVPNRVDRDRDGDGVPNRYDAAPNNPHRQ